MTNGIAGIGKATALRLAQDGASVVINYASDSASANELVKQIGSNRALAVQADAGSVSGIETMVNATVKHFGKIDILIPNAGILPMKDLQHTSEDDFDQIMKLNVKGPYFLVQVRSDPFPRHIINESFDTDPCHRKPSPISPPAPA